MKARLADIAAHADVSEATVSRVLNGKPGVAEATRAGGAHRRWTCSATTGRAGCGARAPAWSG